MFTGSIENGKIFENHEEIAGKLQHIWYRAHQVSPGSYAIKKIDNASQDNDVLNIILERRILGDHGYRSFGGSWSDRGARIVFDEATLAPWRDGKQLLEFLEQGQIDCVFSDSNELDTAAGIRSVESGEAEDHVGQDVVDRSSATISEVQYSRSISTSWLYEAQRKARHWQNWAIEAEKEYKEKGILQDPEGEEIQVGIAAARLSDRVQNLIENAEQWLKDHPREKNRTSIAPALNIKCEP